MNPPYPRRQRASQRLRHLLALEVERILGDLGHRRPLLLGQWSFHRDRRPFLATVHSRWTSLGAADLRVLDDPTLVLLDRFYAELDDFRRYLATTEDMEEGLQQTYDQACDALGERGRAALRALG